MAMVLDSTCRYCFRLLEEPVLLHCNHHICSKCAQAQFSFHLLRNSKCNFPLKTKHTLVAKNETHDEKQTVNICCPICNLKTALFVTQGIASLEKDMQMTEKVQRLLEPEVRMCCKNDCHTVASLHCADCEEDFCQTCFEILHFTSFKKQKNHETVAIDGKLPPNTLQTCPTHGLPLEMFCQKDQTVCCYKCFQDGEHMGHRSVFVDKISEQIRKQANIKLIEINKQIDQIKQTLDDMRKLKEQVSLSYTQFTVQIKESFDRIMKQIELKRDLLVTESGRMENIVLSNISLQQDALGYLLKQKTEMVELLNQWVNGNDLQVLKCQELLQNNQDIVASMLACCENGKANAYLDVSHMEQSIDKLVLITSEPVEMRLPIVSGLSEYLQDGENVTVQWDPIQNNIDTANLMIQITADNDEITSKCFNLPPNETKYQIPVEIEWKLLECTVHCVVNDKTQGPKCPPLIINLHSKEIHAVLTNLEEKCSYQIFERVKDAFKNKKTQLNLSGCEVNNSGSTAVAKVLPYLTQLQQLNISENQIGSAGATSIANAINRMPHLEGLYLYKNQIGDAGIAAIADGVKGLTQLQKLSLWGNQIGDAGAIAIGNSIRELTQLQGLYLEMNQIGDFGATSIAYGIKELTQLQWLYLHHNLISDSSTTIIANAFKNLTQLQGLLLYNNQIGNSGANINTDAIKHLVRLQWLDLSFFEAGRISAAMIARIIKELPQLQGLVLSQNYFGDSGATAIANSIKQLPLLMQLKLDQNKITDYGATAIANAIKGLTRIQQLNIGSNQIRSSGATAIANAIKQLPCLRELHLYSNQIRDSGAMAIVNAIKGSTSLQLLHLQNNIISELVKQQVKQSTIISNFSI